MYINNFLFFSYIVVYLSSPPLLGSTFRTHFLAPSCCPAPRLGCRDLRGPPCHPKAVRSGRRRCAPPRRRPCAGGWQHPAAGRPRPRSQLIFRLKRAHKMETLSRSPPFSARKWWIYGGSIHLSQQPAPLNLLYIGYQCPATHILYISPQQDTDVRITKAQRYPTSTCECNSCFAIL